MTAEPQKGVRLGFLDIAKVVLLPGHYSQVDGEAALGGEPGQIENVRLCRASGRGDQHESRNDATGELPFDGIVLRDHSPTRN